MILLHDCRKALVRSGATLDTIIQCLDQSTLQIALVISPDGLLEGTVTDGDVRRALLRGGNMRTPVENIMSRKSLVVPPDLHREAVLHLMRVNKIHQIPVVDEARRLVGLHVWSEVAGERKHANLFVIMAGGRGTRLRPHTENCPKPMLEVAGKPMLEHIITKAKGEGFARFVLAIHYLGHMVEEYFQDGGRWEVSIEYLREPEPRGTAGALALLGEPPADALVVTNGDVLLEANYAAMLDYHRTHTADATMAVRIHEWSHPYGVVRTSGVEITGFEEKPVQRTQINAGVYVLEPAVLRHVPPETYCDMPALFAALKPNGLRGVVYPLHESWLDVGRLPDLEQARADVTQR